MKDLQLMLTVNEANTLLRALGALPYSQVHGLIEKIQAQAREQLNEGNGASHEPAHEMSTN